MSISQIAAKEYEQFRQFLEQACGIVLGDNKHYLVTSRLGRVMREFQLEDFATLVSRLQSQPRSQLREHIIDAMTTNETLWFRDNYPYEVLRHFILPKMGGGRPRQLRIWSAASSSGQEAYSISITLQEHLDKQPGSLPATVQIIGTDISSSMLSIANSTLYDPLSLGRGLSDERKRRFFTQRGEQWQVNSDIKRRASFREINLLNSFSSLGSFDIVFCRNVLIYFSTELKSDILNRIADTMAPGGYLFLGGSESPTSYTDKFEMVRTPQGVVYQLRDR